MKTALKEAAEFITRIGQTRLSDDRLTPIAKDKLFSLRQNGYVVFDHFVGSQEFASLRDWVSSTYEDRLEFRTPCLAQHHIDESRDADLIERNFNVKMRELQARNLVFHAKDVQSYSQVLRDFAPSTLTLDMPSRKPFYDLWLDDTVTSVISAYMGFRPIMREAFIRRNFPCNYAVMNHKWHRDTNHRRHLLKAFIFFTDCNIETGAHHYVPGSIGAHCFKEGRYFEDHEVDEVFPPEKGKQMISTVSAGTIILEDTRGLHKAGIPKRDFRDLGFAVFVPPSFLHCDKPHYTVSAETYSSLTANQQAFIPNRYVSQ